MPGRLMAKTFDVKRVEVESKDKDGKTTKSMRLPLQSKFNSFSASKNITAVHGFEIEPTNDGVKAVLLYEEGAEDGADTGRLYVKVVELPEISSELQTKINAFSKDKTLDVKAASVAVSGNGVIAAVIYADPNRSAARSTTSAEPAAATA